MKQLFEVHGWLVRWGIAPEKREKTMRQMFPNLDAGWDFTGDTPQRTQ